MAEAVIAAAVSLQNKRKQPRESRRRSRVGLRSIPETYTVLPPLLVEVTRAEAGEEAEADTEDALGIWAADAAATLTSTQQEATLGQAATRTGVLEDVAAAEARAAGPSEAATYQAATNFVFVFLGLVSSTFKNTVHQSVFPFLAI
jgi:hypothetical protein